MKQPNEDPFGGMHLSMGRLVNEIDAINSAAQEQRRQKPPIESAYQRQRVGRSAVGADVRVPEGGAPKSEQNETKQPTSAVPEEQPLALQPESGVEHADDISAGAQKPTEESEDEEFETLQDLIERRKAAGQGTAYIDKISAHSISFGPRNDFRK
ncbi:MAG TPA: hypothetical protein VFZ58_04120 [Candidatus Saccharimonadales bacterium]